MKLHLSRHLLVIAGACALYACSGAPAEPDESADSERTGEAAQKVITDCDYLNPSLFAPLPVPVDFDQELVIRDINVVEDPCRTTFAPTVGCNPGTVGVWTFAFLMQQMAGNVPVHEFVGQWLSTFENPQVVNGFPVNPRPDIRNKLIDPWLVASGCKAGDPIAGPGACKLDLKNAPFRLLAIVNRIDLAGPAAYGGPSPGEGRFVFGSYDINTGAEHQATFILEYLLDAKLNTFDWAKAWHDLNNFPLGSPKYNDLLQNITDNFTLSGRRPSGMNNGSSIGQVRTNEIEYGPQWELREYTLQDIGNGPNDALLLNSTTGQTPDDSMNLTKDLDQYLVTEEPNILAVTHVVPNVLPWGVPLVGGASTAPFLWDNTGSMGPILPMTRHLFGFATCNGCHTGETAAKFVHIAPRPAGSPSNLSNFLGVSPTHSGNPSDGLPASAHVFSDPAGTGLKLEYNEPWRRVCEMTRLLNGDPNPFTKANGEH